MKRLPPSPDRSYCDAMKRLLGALALAMLVVLAAPALALADDVDDLCSGDPSCTVYNDGLGSGSTDIPGFFIAFFIIVLVLGVGTTVYRVSTARTMARNAGLDVDAAGAVALLEDNGLSAAYVASSLRPVPAAAPTDASAPPARPAAERLAERQALKDSGVVSDSEYAARRQAIIDSI